MEVSAAIISNGTEVLCFQKGQSKHDYLSERFEFPGGKLELSESPGDALVREIEEELNYNVPRGSMHFFRDIHYDYEDFSVNIHYFIIFDSDPYFTLNEHKSALWHSIDGLDELNWASADLEIVKCLQSDPLAIQFPEALN